MSFRQWAQMWLDDMAKRHGATVEPSDVDKLVEFWETIQRGTSRHDQLVDHMAALIVQYKKRGQN